MTYLEKRSVSDQKAAQQHGITINYPTSEVTAPAYVDSAWLQIILDELLLNAYESAKEASSPRVEVSATKSSPLDDGSGQFSFLEVRNSGPTLEPEKLAHIFSPFYTTKGREYVGIGLTRAAFLACKSNIKLTFTSSADPDGGNIVHLALPKK